MKFRKLTLEDKKTFDSYLSEDDLGWEYNFATVYVWDVNDTMMVGEQDGIMLLYNTFYNSIVFMPPYLKDKTDFGKGLNLIAEFAAASGIKYRLRGLQANQAENLDKNKYIFGASRDDFDYIYRTDDLKYLRGKTYHSKRNFITRFISSYDYTLTEYSESDFDGLMALYDSWEVDASHTTLAMEKRAIERAFRFREALELKIDVIKVDDEYAGFSVSSIAGNGIVHTIFEKGDTKYIGIYQALNQLTAKKYFPDGALVNRQEDMGIEGLRRAKLSYSPVMLYEKYFAEEKHID